MIIPKPGEPGYAAWLVAVADATKALPQDRGRDYDQGVADIIAVLLGVREPEPEPSDTKRRFRVYGLRTETDKVAFDVMAWSVEDAKFMAEKLAEEVDDSEIDSQSVIENHIDWLSAEAVD